jgi:heme exporter protein B
VTAFLGILGRDLRLALRQLTDASLVVMFFVLCAALFPFAVGPEPNLLARIAPGVIAVAAMLSVLLSLERLFLADYEDGNLELLVLSPAPLEFIVLAKVLAHWCTTGLPLIVAAPVIALLYDMPADGLPVMLFALTLATPSLSLIGAIGAALTLGARRGGVLILLLVLPLCISVLIFTVAAIDAALSGLPSGPHLSFLGALLLTALPLAPWASAAALRQALE